MVLAMITKNITNWPTRLMNETLFLACNRVASSPRKMKQTAVAGFMAILDAAPCFKMLISKAQPMRAITPKISGSVGSMNLILDTDIWPIIIYAH